MYICVSPNTSPQHICTRSTKNSSMCTLISNMATVTLVWQFTKSAGAVHYTVPSRTRFPFVARLARRVGRVATYDRTRPGYWYSTTFFCLHWLRFPGGLVVSLECSTDFRVSQDTFCVKAAPVLLTVTRSFYFQ